MGNVAKVKVALMIDTTDEIEKLIVDGLKDICDVNIFDLSYDADIDAEVLICWKASEELIDRIDGLRLIHVWGAGFDQIDVEFAHKKNIVVCTTQGAMASAIAEYVIMQILVWERELLHWNKVAHSGIWNWNMRNSCLFTELRDRVLGIIGVGKIGTKVACIASAFGMKIWGIKRQLHTLSEDIKGKFCFIGTPADMDMLLENVDYLSLHVPLTQDTYHMIDYTRLRKLKPAAVIINTSRGDVIDEQALACALKQGDIRGASLDVLTQEPITLQHPLKDIKNLILTCHHAGNTIQAIKNNIDIIRKNIEVFKKGGDVAELINKIN